MKALRSTGLLVVTGLAVVVPFAQQYAGTVFVLALCYAIVTAGMAVQIGFSQQIAFSQSVFMGAGAYGVAMLNTHLSMPSLLATPIVMAGAGLAALLLGSVVTRASGLALAVATLMLPLIAVGYLSSAGYLGGSIGTPLTGNLWEGASTEATAVGNGLITVAVLALVVFVCTRILSSDIGLELYVLGVDEPTAAAMGVRTSRRKLELFVLGSVFAALGGAVYAGTQLFVPASLVDPTAELTLLMMLFVGGRKSILGAVVGALAIQYLYGASNWVSVNILIVEGVLLTVVLLADPDGLAGLVAALARARPPAPAAVPLERTNGAIGHARLDVLPDSQRADGAIGTLKLLECIGVGKEYGGLAVLDDVTLTLPGRGLFGLCGPNGAGKSTLLGVIGGSVRPSRGRVLLDGTDVTRLPPQERFQLGVSRTFQAVHLIRGRTVLDNVAVACLSSHRSSLVRGIVRSRLAEARAKAAEALDYLGMGQLSGQDVSSLTLENQRMVELARAIAARPRLLLLDEPASGLSGPQRERLAEVLRAAGELACVLLVEHDLDLVARISQKIFVLARGRLVFDGDPEDFRSSDVVNSLLQGGRGGRVPPP
ncbi:MAG: ATP-binding cassette domain-containing protein [Streptosporangiaceae bacterium]|nr:ATP-binding cassette domain-containing protein [Streptosporangiaceae bacterium]